MTYAYANHEGLSMFQECLISDAQGTFLRINTEGKRSVWPEETLLEDAQSLTEGSEHTNDVFEMDCTGSKEMALHDQPY